jgi:hypothetical protein
MILSMFSRCVSPFSLINIRYSLLSTIILLGLQSPVYAHAQNAAGSIVGTVTDTTGAALSNVEIRIMSVATSATRTLRATSAGTYAVVGLPPGPYIITFTAPNFSTGHLNINLPVGETANGDFQMKVGSYDTTVTVSSEDTNSLNTVQATVGDVMTSKEIDDIPLNGRNFLDLAQLNAGVQIQDGSNLDPTKEGFAGISLQGRSGRSTQIEIDGIDVTDATVGTTTLNVSEDAIQEFQVGQSTLDPSSGLTTSGAVNVITRSGSNAMHGSAFYQYRNADLAAKLGETKAPFDQSQVGLRIAGPAIKNRLFWFANYEHTLQHGTTFTDSSFSQYDGAFSTPFHEALATGRLDWNISNNWRAFYAYHFDQVNVISGFGGISLQPFTTRTLNGVQTLGVDGNTGSFSHSIRFGGMHFRNFIADALTEVSGLPAAFPGGVNAAITIGPDVTCSSGIDEICLGPNFAQPQTTLQRNTELRYDGSATVKTHVIRYGMAFERIPESFVSASANAPILNSNVGPTQTAIASAGPYPGGASNPLNYPLEVVTFGNGLGYLTDRPGLGLPDGATTSNRLSLYAEDVWKVRPNLTITPGLRYDRVTGRTNSDLPGIPDLEPLLPGAGHRVPQPNLNFGPQLGMNWVPDKDGKTSIRGGIGLYYDGIPIENSLFDAGLRFPTGLANQTLQVTGGELPGTTTNLSPYIGQPLGAVVSQLVAAGQAYQAATRQSSLNFNPSGLPGFEDPNGFDFSTGIGVLPPTFKTPRSLGLNVGIQRQLGKATFVSVDYLRNVNTHSFLNHDVNLVGATETFNSTAAKAAITKTLAECGANDTTVDEAIASCPGLHSSGGVTIEDFGSNGLGSPASGLQEQSIPPNNGYAFPGKDTQLGQIGVSDTIGRSVYNALQVRIQQDVSHPLRGVRRMSLIANYSFSRFVSTEPDQDVVFSQNAFDSLHPLKFIGPNSLDRTHMFSFSDTLEIRGGLQVIPLVRIYSPLSQTLTIPLQCSCPAEIFLTDVTGDGTGGDILPGTNVGSFGRSVKLGDLNKVITNFDSASAGQLTPAGKAVVGAGLFTSAQMIALGATIPNIAPAPHGQVGLDDFVADDIRVEWPIHPGPWLGEAFRVEPYADVFNIANKANFDPPAGFATAPLSGALNGSIGSLNGTTYNEQTNRYGQGSGVFSQGTPRQFQFGMRITF